MNSEQRVEKPEFSIVNKVTTILGRRGSGKSCIALELIKKEQTSFDKIFLFSPTEKINGFFTKGGVVQPNYVFETFDEKFIKNVFQKIEEINAGLDKDQQKKVLFILDDLIGDQNLHSSPGLKLLAVRSRHINVSVMILIQHISSLHPILKNNSDNVLISTINRTSIQIVGELFCLGRGNTVKRFVDMYEKTCHDFTFLVINNQCTKNNTIEEIYSSMRVSL
jgi:hypothetical protein